MNPFDLRGPEFLAFYAVLAAVVLVLVRIGRKFADGDDGREPPRESDPYALALLRGGRPEAVRTALLALAERGALKIEGRSVEAEKGAKLAPGLEAAIGRRLEASHWLPGVATAPEVVAALRTLEAELRAKELLPSEAAASRRVLLAGLAASLLLGTAAVKITVALQRGHTNVLFLVLMAGVAVFFAVRLGIRRTTRKGDRLLADLRTLLRPLRSRSASADARHAPDWSMNVAMLAAVFGSEMVPASRTKRALWPATSGGSAGSSGAASSCGGGGSCGGGCGGGGCGGCGS